MDSVSTTAFAPAARSTPEEIQRQYALIKGLPQVVRFMDALPTMALVLNAQRQIVFANRAFLKFVGAADAAELVGQRHGEAVDCIRASVLGQRPGEATQCVRANESPGGCGTTVFCKTCGAVRAILNSQNGVEDIQECRMLRHVHQHTEALDLRVWAQPLEVEGTQFTVFAVADISNEKRRQSLERIFFHDLLNTAGAVQGVAGILRETKDEHEVSELTRMLCASSEQLIDEIQSQSLLTKAENNDLVAQPVTLDLLPLLCAVVAAFSLHEVAHERILRMAPEAQNVQVRTDATLLRRVVINLVKNALEASAPGETVTLNIQRDDALVVITVHNPAVMTEEIRLQIFNRSFSTRGPGRGLGTYSAQLLTERYLGGQLSFVSTAPQGTVFKVTLPPQR